MGLHKMLATYEVKYIHRNGGYNGGVITKRDRILTNSVKSAIRFVYQQNGRNVKRIIKAFKEVN